MQVELVPLGAVAEVELLLLYELVPVAQTTYLLEVLVAVQVQIIPMRVQRMLKRQVLMLLIILEQVYMLVRLGREQAKPVTALLQALVLTEGVVAAVVEDYWVVIHLLDQPPNQNGVASVVTGDQMEWWLGLL